MRRNRQDGYKGRPNGDGDGVIKGLTSPTVSIILTTHLNVDSGPGRGGAGLRGGQGAQGDGAGLAGRSLCQSENESNIKK